MAEELGEPHFWAHIIMHMPHMRISAIIILLLMLATDGPLLSEGWPHYSPLPPLCQCDAGKIIDINESAPDGGRILVHVALKL